MIHCLPDTVVLTNSKPFDYAIINNLKTHSPLDYATIKFTLSTPALDNAIIKLWRKHTHDNGATAYAFSPEQAGIILVTLRRKTAEL